MEYFLLVYFGIVGAIVLYAVTRDEPCDRQLKGYNCNKSCKHIKEK